MTQWTHDQLAEALAPVKIGGQICRYTPEKIDEILPKINEINRLKKEKNALVLAHSYVSPEILRAVADYSGDSYELSKRAQEATADTIVFAAVRFMAETAKLLNPNKQVIIPGTNPGCSLADSITKEDMIQLRKDYPNYTFVCYINTTADVKAYSDVCVTSSNVYDIVEAIPNDHIYFLPDQLMGQNVIKEMAVRGVQKTIKCWEGRCYVHDDYDPDMIAYIKSEYPGVRVLSHPECHQSVIEKSDFVGSTSQMCKDVATSEAPSFLMLTECGLTSRLQLEFPSKQFVGSCTMCRYMKSNQLDDILRALTDPIPESIIEIDTSVQTQALSCIQAMFDYTK